MERGEQRNWKFGWSCVYYLFIFYINTHCHTSHKDSLHAVRCPACCSPGGERSALDVWQICCDRVRNGVNPRQALSSEADTEPGSTVWTAAAFVQPGAALQIL